MATCTQSLHRTWWPVVSIAIVTESISFNSLTPGRCGNNFRNAIFEHMLWIKFMNIKSCEIVLGKIPQPTFDKKSTLVQVMAYLSQGQPWLMLPYGFPKP